MTENEIKENAIYGVILTSGQRVGIVEVEPDEKLFDCARRAIDCDWIEVVEPAGLRGQDYVLLIDEESKQTFCGYWLGNIASRLGDIVHANTPHYICAGFIPERGAIVIDGGLCDGGTSVRFSQMGYKVYGFEMDKKNYELSLKVAKEKNFVVENLGLGSYKHMAHPHS